MLYARPRENPACLVGPEYRQRADRVPADASRASRPDRTRWLSDSARLNVDIGARTSTTTGPVEPPDDRPERDDHIALLPAVDLAGRVEPCQRYRCWFFARLLVPSTRTKQASFPKADHGPREAERVRRRSPIGYSLHPQLLLGLEHVGEAVPKLRQGYDRGVVQRAPGTAQSYGAGGPKRFTVGGATSKVVAKPRRRVTDGLGLSGRVGRRRSSGRRGAQSSRTVLWPSGIRRLAHRDRPTRMPGADGGQRAASDA